MVNFALEASGPVAVYAAVCKSRSLWPPMRKGALLTDIPEHCPLHFNTAHLDRFHPAFTAAKSALCERHRNSGWFLHWVFRSSKVTMDEGVSFAPVQPKPDDDLPDKEFRTPEGTGILVRIILSPSLHLGTQLLESHSSATLTRILSCWIARPQQNPQRTLSSVWPKHARASPCSSTGRRQVAPLHGHGPYGRFDCSIGVEPSYTPLSLGHPHTMKCAYAPSGR